MYWRLLVVWLMSQLLGFALPALPSVTKPEMPPVLACEQSQAGNHGYDAGFQSGLLYDTELLPVTTEGLSHPVGTIAISPCYDSASVSSIRVVGTPRAPAVEKAVFLAAKTEGQFFKIGEKLPDGRIAGNGPGAALRNGPDFSFRTGTPQEVYRRLETYHGIDPTLASERLHTIKAANEFGAADNVVLDLTGNVYNPGTGEWIGSLTQGGKKFH